MTAPFIAVVLVAAVLLVYWRFVLLIVAACLLALMAFGLGVVRAEPVTGAPPSTGGPTTTQVVPGPPGQDVGQPHG